MFRPAIAAPQKQRTKDIHTLFDAKSVTKTTDDDKQPELVLTTQTDTIDSIDLLAAEAEGTDHLHQVKPYAHGTVIWLWPSEFIIETKELLPLQPPTKKAMTGDKLFTETYLTHYGMNLVKGIGARGDFRPPEAAIVDGNLYDKCIYGTQRHWDVAHHRVDSDCSGFVSLTINPFIARLFGHKSTLTRDKESYFIYVAKFNQGLFANHNKSDPFPIELEVTVLPNDSKVIGYAECTESTCATPTLNTELPDAEKNLVLEFFQNKRLSQNKHQFILRLFSQEPLTDAEKTSAMQDADQKLIMQLFGSQLPPDLTKNASVPDTKTTPTEAPKLKKTPKKHTSLNYDAIAFTLVHNFIIGVCSKAFIDDLEHRLRKKNFSDVEIYWITQVLLAIGLMGCGSSPATTISTPIFNYLLNRYTKLTLEQANYLTTGIALGISMLSTPAKGASCVAELAGLVGNSAGRYAYTLAKKGLHAAKSIFAAKETSTSPTVEALDYNELYDVPIEQRTSFGSGF